MRFLLSALLAVMLAVTMPLALTGAATDSRNIRAAGRA